MKSYQHLEAAGTIPRRCRLASWLIAWVGFIAFTSLAQAQVLKNGDPSFDSPLATDWDVYNPISGIEAVVNLSLTAATGFSAGPKLHLYLPKAATNNYTQYITVGQTLRLSKSRKYRYSAKIKWMNPGGTDAPSQAIVSTWARNQDSSYSGMDLFINDGTTVNHFFEFTPNQDGNVTCYVGLLTNIEGPRNTDIIVDDFRIDDIGAADNDPDNRVGNFLAGSAFTNLTNPTTTSSPWKLTQNNSHGVAGLSSTIQNVAGNYKLRLALPGSGNPDYHNKTWTGVTQSTTLYAGNTYRLSATVDRQTPNNNTTQTILNFYAFKPKAAGVDGDYPIWLGDIDYPFTNGTSHVYSKTFYVTKTATYQITVRNFGWAQNGQASTVDVDNVQLERVP